VTTDERVARARGALHEEVCWLSCKTRQEDTVL